MPDNNELLERIELLEHRVESLEHDVLARLTRLEGVFHRLQRRLARLGDSQGIRGEIADASRELAELVSKEREPEG